MRNLARLGRSTVSRPGRCWASGGRRRAPARQTPRNLLGFKDGTRNVDTDEQYSKFVWVENGDQPWIEGGTYQVVRKIRMLLETWDTDRVGNQQDIFGRHKQEGSPLTGTAEMDTPDFAAVDRRATR